MCTNILKYDKVTVKKVIFLIAFDCLICSWFIFAKRLFCNAIFFVVYFLKFLIYATRVCWIPVYAILFMLSCLCYPVYAILFMLSCLCHSVFLFPKTFKLFGFIAYCNEAQYNSWKTFHGSWPGTQSTLHVVIAVAHCYTCIH
jgi:hypothetical protein